MQERIYHYTSLDALVGILKKEIDDSSGKREKQNSLTFWGSRYDCMNDPQDYLFASKVVLPKILKAFELREDISEDILIEQTSRYPL